MSQLSDATSRLTHWIVADREAGAISALPLDQIAAIQQDIATVLEVFDYAMYRDRRLTYTANDDIVVNLVWNITPDQPHIVAVCSDPSCAEGYRSFVEGLGGGFYVEPVVMDHAFGRKDIQSIARKASPKPRSRAN